MLISDYFEYYRLAAYLTRYTAEPIAVTMGVANLLDLFNEKYYTELEGGILEAFGKLFTKDLRLYVYPLRDHATGVLKTVENAGNTRGEIQICIVTWWDKAESRNSRTFDESVLHIFSRDVLKRIKESDPSWETWCLQRWPNGQASPTVWLPRPEAIEDAAFAAANR